VVGRNRFPSLADQENLPYTNAVLQESFRVSSLAYTGVPRLANADLRVGPYTIPKGDASMGERGFNLFICIFDPSRPRRILTSDVGRANIFFCKIKHMNM
jgi:hypothetical protein